MPFEYMFCFIRSEQCIKIISLLCKLKAAGVTGKLLNWFKNYLLDRRQRVILPGVNSDWSKIFAGVPLGSILGPLLFLFFFFVFFYKRYCKQNWLLYTLI